MRHWLLLAQQAVGPVLERLDPPRRAAVVMALLALVLTGLLLVAIVMLGANWVRRLARYKPGLHRSTLDAQAAASNLRLRESLQSILPDIKSGDTIQMDGSSKETKVDS
ncbi:MAG: hypothetical protein WD738_11790 [Pirellulales bacterium]